MSNRVSPRFETLTDPPDPALVESLAELLLDGGVAVLPTDTLYALCAAAESVAGLARVFEIKGRDPAKPLPVFVGSLSQARAVAKFDSAAEKLAARFWPGALTLVLERRPGIEWDLGGDPRTVGLRWPESAFLSELCARSGPITGTSANPSGGEIAATAQEAYSLLGDSVDVYVDGGPAPSTIPSTVVRLGSSPELLREGAISMREIREVLR